MRPCLSRVLSGYRSGVHKAPKGIVLSGVEPEQVKDYNLLDLEVKQDAKHFVQVEEGLGYILLTPREEAEALKALGELVKAPKPGLTHWPEGRNLCARG